MKWGDFYKKRRKNRRICVYNGLNGGERKVKSFKLAIERWGKVWYNESVIRRILIKNVRVSSVLTKFSCRVKKRGCVLKKT